MSKRKSYTNYHTKVFALLGFLSPSNRGSLATVMILLYTFLGFVGGYVSARVYKFFQGDKWKQNFALTPVLVPGSVFAVFFLLNLFVWARGASGAVPFTTMLVLVCMWFVISLPLSLAGSWVGFRQSAIAPPVRTNQIPRQIPVQQDGSRGAGYFASIPRTLIVGMAPFGAIAVELYFITYSIWFNKIYYMFGFLFLGYALMVITCAAVTVLMIYFTLCAENYHWQWRSFMMAGATAAYVFAFAMLCWVRSFSFASWTSGILYLGYSALISLLCFVLTGKFIFLFFFFFFENNNNNEIGNVSLIPCVNEQVPSASSLPGSLSCASTLPSRLTDTDQTNDICNMKYNMIYMARGIWHMAYGMTRQLIKGLWFVV